MRPISIRVLFFILIDACRSQEKPLVWLALLLSLSELRSWPQLSLPVVAGISDKALSLWDHETLWI